MCLGETDLIDTENHISGRRSTISNIYIFKTNSQQTIKKIKSKRNISHQLKKYYGQQKKYYE